MQYFSLELFIEALMLVVHRNNADVTRLVVKILEIYTKETEETSGIGATNFYEFYVNLIKEILEINATPGAVHDLQSILLKLKTNPVVLQDPELYSNLKTIFNRTSPMTDAQYEFAMRKLHNCLIWYSNIKNVKQMFGKLMNGNIVDSPAKQEKLMAELNTLCSGIIQKNSERLDLNNESDGMQARFLDFRDIESVNKSLATYQKTSVANVFKTGLQGLNRAFGPCGGWKLGESIVFNALSFHGKTLSLLKMARWQVMYNRVSIDIKNPTCIIYSLENETPQNLMLLFKELYINIHEKVPPVGMSDVEVVEMCTQFFNKNGWRLVIDRRLGAEFGFDELVMNFESYVQSGFTPVMCVIDYMNMLRKTNNSTRGDHLLLREVYTNVCNYLKSKNCTLVTAHQLNRKAADAARANPVGVVKRFGIDMLADGMDPQREVDVAIYQYIERDAAGRPFLTFNMDKHRYDTETAPEDKYTAYQFDPVLGILDDVNKEDASIKNIHAVPFDKSDVKSEEREKTDNFFGE